MASIRVTPQPVIGLVGGGQLGRMMALEAPRLGLSIRVLDPLVDAAPSAFFAAHVGHPYESGMP